MPYLVNESEALKKKLSTIRLTASNTEDTGNFVPVRFVSPDFELANASYPGIYIAYGLVAKADDREHRGPTNLPYAPEGFSGNVQVPVDMEDPNNQNTVPWLINSSSPGGTLDSPYYVNDYPIPVNIDYRIAVLTRNYQQAYEAIDQMSELNYLPSRFGYLEVPQDGTVRTLELLGGPEVSPETDANDKRMVRTLYSVRVASEKNLYEIQQIHRVDEVDLTLVSFNPQD